MALGNFELLDESGIGLAEEGNLDERERRLVIGAANYYSFVHPGRTIRFTVVRAMNMGYPSLTDDHSRHIGWREDREPVGSLLVRSKVPPIIKETARSAGLLDFVLDIGGTPELLNTYDQLSGPVGRARKAVRSLIPIQYDVLRQIRTDVAERVLRANKLPRRPPVRLTRGTQPPLRGKVPAVLFGLHWLELGGAERWALECVQMVKELGGVPIVVTDRPSHHEWITRPELDGAVVMTLTHPITLGNDAAFLNGLFATYDLRGIHVHHNTWLYDRLGWIKSVRPDLPVVDSLHILEWRTGGFVDQAVLASSLIDTHHVISPRLRDYLVDQREIAASKVALATLATMTTSGISNTAKDADSSPSKPFTVAYVGRFHQQKRPYLFVKLAAALRATAPGPVRFIMHGDGELGDEVRALRTKMGLSGALDLRGPDVPVAKTLADSDVLVITSENEGLTLTSFEASAAGIPVISTDVGSQASVVADDLLCPRHTYAFIRSASARIRTMMSSPAQRKRWLDDQLAKTEAVAKLPSARTWAKDLYQGWLS